MDGAEAAMRRIDAGPSLGSAAMVARCSAGWRVRAAAMDRCSGYHSIIGICSPCAHLLVQMFSYSNGALPSNRLGAAAVTGADRVMELRSDGCWLPGKPL